MLNKNQELDFFFFFLLLLIKLTQKGGAKCIYAYLKQSILAD